jgi:hypothetical protein
MKAQAPTTTKHPAKKHTPAIWANIDHELRASLRELGVVHPDSFTTGQASSYLTEFKGIPTAKSTLEVFRCQGRGPRYRKIGSRVFYTLAELDRYAQGVDIKIFDPSEN